MRLLGWKAGRSSRRFQPAVSDRSVAAQRGWERYRRAVSVMKSISLMFETCSCRGMLLSILRLIRSPDLAIYELMKDLP
jgi:hypothetical protein